MCHEPGVTMLHCIPCCEADPPVQGEIWDDEKREEEHFWEQKDNNEEDSGDA